MNSWQLAFKQGCIVLQIVNKYSAPNIAQENGL